MKAVQLLSNRPAKASELLLKSPVAVRFFKTVNNAFDILNSRIPLHKHRCIYKSSENPVRIRLQIKLILNFYWNCRLKKSAGTGGCKETHEDT